MGNQQLRMLKEVTETIPSVICNRKEHYRITTGPNEDEVEIMNREEWLESHLEWVMDSIGIMFHEELEPLSSTGKEQCSKEEGKD